MKKKILLSVTLLTLLTFPPLVSPIHAEQPYIAEKYYGEGQNSHYVLSKGKYLNFYNGPSVDSGIAVTGKEINATDVVAKMSNGWYKLPAGKGVFWYINPDDIVEISPYESTILQAPVFPFPDEPQAPEPQPSVPAITSKPTDDTDANLATIVKTLGFTIQDDNGVTKYHYAPKGKDVTNGGWEVVEMFKGDNYETGIVLQGWTPNENTTDGIETVPAAIREILKYYYPTGYDKIYSLLDDGYRAENVVMDPKDINYTMYLFDNRELEFKFFNGGAIGMYIGKPGLRYNSEFELPANEVVVKVNGKLNDSEQSGTIRGNSTLVPLRWITEQLGATVNWNGDTQTATITKGINTVSMTIGSTTAIDNGENVTLETAPISMQGITLVPVRFLAQSLGANVTFDNSNPYLGIVNINE